MDGKGIAAGDVSEWGADDVVEGVTREAPLGVTVLGVVLGVVLFGACIVCACAVGGVVPG